MLKLATAGAMKTFIFWVLVGPNWMATRRIKFVRRRVIKILGLLFTRWTRSPSKGSLLDQPKDGAWGWKMSMISYIEGIRFQQDGKTSNQDGVHICGPGSRICISNILGTVADDAIALDAGAGAEDYRGSARGSGG